jgi:Kef-type K+ transport system membrane component KefB
VWLADEFGLDVLLGAFTAGVVIRLFLSGGEREETALVTDKLEAVGFGFLIPMFFVVSGVRFDLSGLLGSAFALALMPVLLGLFMITRGLPVAIVYRSALGRADRVALALFASTALPLVVVIVNIGVQSGRLREDLGASLVGAAMLSLVVLPLLALRARRNSRPAGLPTAG